MRLVVLVTLLQMIADHQHVRGAHEDDFDEVWGMVVVTFHNSRGPTVTLNFHADGAIPSTPFAEMGSGESHTVRSEEGSVWSAWVGNQQVAIWRIGEGDNQHFYISETAARWQLGKRAAPTADQRVILSGWDWASWELGRTLDVPPMHSPLFSNFFSKEECRQLMKFLDGATELWSNQPGPVDKMPEVQLDMFGKDLWIPMGTPRVSYDRLVDALIQRIIRAGQWYFQDETLQLSWLFARKYAPGERYNLQTHPDQCRLTATILLNDAESFKGHGGDYYIAGAEEFREAQEPFHGDPEFEDYMEGKTFVQLREQDLETVLAANPQWAQPQEQGGVAFHTAGALHGITRVRQGLRYSLVCFFEYGHEIPELDKNWDQMKNWDQI